jgi:hypothetical protein
MNYYFSVQYSAIQKTVLRHNRLWSMAGISQGLSRLNEIEMERIAHDHSGTTMVAGGGKFTAFFNNPNQTEQAKKAIVQELASRFPMLEFQASAVISAKRFQSSLTQEEKDNGAKDDSAKGQGIIDKLNNGKRCFRGYGTSFLPHLAVCEECGEFPAESGYNLDKKILCRSCYEAKTAATINFKALDSASSPQTTLEKIYSAYLKQVRVATSCDPLLDFTDLFPAKSGDTGKEAGGRMAVWLSDLNNMNQKVPIWLAQNEDNILATFNQVKEVNIEIVALALARTFTEEVVKNRAHLPFRLVVAGGDDLCLVMAEEHILTFAEEMDRAVREKIDKLGSSHYLSMDWLQKNDKRKPVKDGTKPDPIGPYSFGAAFVVTSTHTPFQRIHELGEALMKEAKEKTHRLGNSVNWRIMAEGEAISDNLLPFERPLFIAREELAAAQKSPKAKEHPEGFQGLSLADYLQLRKDFHGISSSHRFALIAKLIELRDREPEFENWLKRFDSGERPKDFSGLLLDPRLRQGGQADGSLVPARIATLFELLAIKDRPKQGKTNEEKEDDR